MNKVSIISLILTGLMSTNKTFATSATFTLEEHNSMNESHLLTEIRHINAHLILHLDVNGVLVSVDTVQEKTADDIIYANLAENVSALWKAPLHLPEGSILPPEWTPPSNPITYDQYVKKYLLDHMLYESPNPDATVTELNATEKRNGKTKKAYQKFFYSHFLENLRISEISTRTSEQCAEIIATTQSSLSAQSGIVAESFYNMINWLREFHISFSIVLRSFGTDTEAVLDEIIQRTHLHQGEILNFREENILDRQGRAVGNIHTLSQILKSFAPETISSVQCDYDFWHNYGHKEKEDFGKPVVISTLEYPTDLPVISMFFDDNLIEKEIGRPVFEEGTPLVSVDELISRGIFVPVDTLEVINHPHYFKEKILKAIAWNLRHKK